LAVIPLLAKLRECFIWGTMGAIVGVLLSYYLYRIGIPIVPFVYQAF
jgi:hypothetical protein